MDTPASGGSVEERFARRVKFEREARGLSQADLAKLVSKKGIRAQATTIAKIEARDRDRPRTIRLDEAAAIADVFETTVDDLLGNTRKFDRQAAVRRIPTIASQALQSIVAAISQVDLALDALNVSPDELGKWANLHDEELIDDLLLSLPDIRALLMLSKRKSLAESLNSLSEAIGEIGSYATADEERAMDAYRMWTKSISADNTSSTATDANPS